MSEIKKMSREQEDAEVVVLLDYSTNEAKITVSDWPAQARKFEKLFGKPSKVFRQDKKYLDDGRVLSIDRVRSVQWVVPIGELSIRKRRMSSGGFKKVKIAS